MLFRRVDYASPVDNAPDWYLQHDGAPNRPCVVMLHGHGAHGDQLLTRPDLARWLPELAALQISLLLPNLRDNAWMSPAAAADQIIPVEQARTLAKRLAGRTNFDYREIPDGDHDSPLAFGLEDLRDMLKKLERTQP